LIDTAEEMLARDQPKSSWSGSIRMEGAARKLAAPTRARNATAATSQAWWRREGAVRAGGAGGAISDVTTVSLRDVVSPEQLPE
jgi:hypothetical protein